MRGSCKRHVVGLSLEHQRLLDNMPDYKDHAVGKHICQERGSVWDLQITQS